LPQSAKLAEAQKAVMELKADLAPFLAKEAANRAAEAQRAVSRSPLPLLASLNDSSTRSLESPFPQAGIGHYPICITIPTRLLKNVDNRPRVEVTGCRRTAQCSAVHLCEKAAYNGHLEVLQWARNNGCPWDEKTCSWAAGNGHLEVLQWARNNG
ncbi:unnamed protein product, partial [Ectocarpus fasciculatus]